MIRRLLAETHVDPWGLEGTGSNVPELGARMGHGDLAKIWVSIEIESYQASTIRVA